MTQLLSNARFHYEIEAFFFVLLNLFFLRLKRQKALSKAKAINKKN